MALLTLLCLRDSLFDSVKQEPHSPASPATAFMKVTASLASADLGTTAHTHTVALKRNTAVTSLSSSLRNTVKLSVHWHKSQLKVG